MRGPHKSVDVVRCSPRPRAVWHKLYGDATHLGDDAARVVIVSTEVGMHCFVL